MPTIKNTSYKVHVQDTDQAEVDSVNIENGAMLRTDDALYMGHNGSNVIVYPQGGTSSLGWTRYDDSEYTSSNKLTLSDQAEVVMPNNANTIIRSNSNLDFYNGTSKKILGINENDTYMFTFAFKAQTPNANQTHLDWRLVGSGEIERVAGVVVFHKGNDVEQNEHILVQYYTDSTFVTDGVQLKIQSHGNSAEIWDVIYFIQRTQNASLS
jgi:hypothetical protein